MKFDFHRFSKFSSPLFASMSYSFWLAIFKRFPPLSLLMDAELISVSDSRKLRELSSFAPPLFPSEFLTASDQRVSAFDFSFFFYS